MTRVTPPYFFDEFLLPIRRVQPTPRERELGLTTRDLEWLHTLYYATDAARQNARLRDAPMVVEKLFIHPASATSIPLAGAFMMSPGPDDPKAVLYTPYGGLEVFDDRDTLLAQITVRLRDARQRTDLVSFLSIRQREALPTDASLSVSTALIEGAVMANQEQTLQAAQQLNVQEMLEQLQRTPTLPWMLDTLLVIMARSYFPNLDQRDTRMNSYAVDDASPEERRWLASISLSHAVLQFYVDQGWPADQIRTFSNPRHDAGGLPQAERESDLQQWESLVAQTAGIFSKLLKSLLLTYWNEDYKQGQSRSEFFAQVMSDKFRLDLLLKRQRGIVSSAESHRLLAMFLPDQTARTAYADTLRIEKVRIQAPYHHYVELAGTLMINDENAYLYTQSQGLQVVKDMDDLKNMLRAMLKATGHEDELLNLVSLAERDVFINLDEVQIIGLPVTSGVFTEMLEDVVAKQASNVEYALGLYRRSEGAIDLDALLDQALDVRHMLDERVLKLDTRGRWTLHPVSTGNGRPSTVLAERAKQRLQQLQAIDSAVALAHSNAPTLRKLVAHALNLELEKRRLDLQAEEVFINTYATEAQQREERLPHASENLVDHFITRLAQETQPLDDSPRSGLYGRRQDGAALKLNNLTAHTVNSIVAQVLPSFTFHDLRTLPKVFLETQQSQLSYAMLQGLRNEAELRRLNKTLLPNAQEVLDTVLRPDSLARLTRHALNGFLPDAFGLSVLSARRARPAHWPTVLSSPNAVVSIRCVQDRPYCGRPVTVRRFLPRSSHCAPDCKSV